MNITEATYNYEIITWKDGTVEKRKLGIDAKIDNIEMFVPIDEANRHYQEILKWVAAGNTIAEPGE
jgi:hypothetical protein